MNQPAGFWIRFGAALLDGLLFLVLGFLCFILFSESAATKLINSLFDAYRFLLPALWYGYTVGKRALGIRIIRTDGRNVGFWNMMRRNIFGGLLYLSPLLIALIVCYAILGQQNVELFLSDKTVWLESDAGIRLVDERTSEVHQIEGLNAASIALEIGTFSLFGLILVSGLMVGIRKDKRSLHDWVAGTYVTRSRPEGQDRLFPHEEEAVPVDKVNI